MEKLVFSQYERELKRYSGRAAIAGLGAYMLFIFIMAGPLLLSQFFPVDQKIKDLSEIARLILAIVLFVLAGATSLTFLYLVIRKLRNNPLLTCPACAQQVVDNKAWRQVFSEGTCRHCTAQIVEQHELPQPKIPAFHLSHVILIFGIFLIGISAFIPWDRAIILLSLGVVNVVGAGWSLWRIKHAQAIN